MKSWRFANTVIGYYGVGKAKYDVYICPYCGAPHVVPHKVLPISPICPECSHPVAEVEKK